MHYGMTDLMSDGKTTALMRSFFIYKDYPSLLIVAT